MSGTLLVFLVSGGSAAQFGQRAAADPVRLVQAWEEETTRVAAPVGLAFSPGDKAFYVLGRREGPIAATNETDVAKLAPFDLAPDSSRPVVTRLAAVVADPINVAFDAHANRLLLLDQAQELLGVRAGDRGELDSASLERVRVGPLGLRNPQGMTVDPATGTVFILDAGVSSILRLEPGPGGSLVLAAAPLDLRPSGLRRVRGLAFNPSTGHLQLGSGRTLVELTTAGEVVSTRDLSSLDLANPEGIVVAPSGDLTDAPTEQSIYLADSGGATRSGQVLELSLEALPAAAAIDFTSQLVRTVNLGGLSPPSPDSSGITHVSTTDRLLIVDGEVEETVGGVSHFQGANVWELNRNGLNLSRTTNISTRSPTQLPLSNEPVGVAFNPSNGHYYVSDDNAKRVYDVNPGAEGLLGTSNDTWTSFSTQGSGNNDPEGLAYKASTNRIYVADGVNREVYEYTTSGSPLGHWDTARYGVDDPESVEVNSTTGNLYVLSNRQSGPIVIETTPNGSLIQTIGVAASGARKPAGIAYANASNGSGAKRFYIVDRGIDNNSNKNAVDGKLYEMTTPGGGGPPPPPGGGQLDVRVSTSANDAEEVAGSGAVQRGDGDLDMMTDTSDTKLVVGTRFTGIGIPPGATITAAYLQFTADEVQTAPTSLTIRGQAADNPTTFTTTTGNLSSRPTTAASAAWSPASWQTIGESGPAQRTSSLSAIVQELVNRPGWASGNAIVLLVRGNGRRVAVAHNQNPAAAPLLHVEWTS